MSVVPLLLLISFSSCRVLHEFGVDQREANAIVDKHNELRRLVAQGKLDKQPKAADLKQIKYDLRLAQEAQKIADFCVFGHQRVEDDRWKDVGQNLYRRVHNRIVLGADWNRTIDKWFREHRFYTYSNKPNAPTAHYTQLIGARTEYVGCGYSLCKDDELKYVKLYVCNYGPFVNYVNKYPYKIGNGCEDLC